MQELPLKAKYADVLLKGELASFLAEQRKAGNSFDAIARDLYIKTDGQVVVTGPTVTAWWNQIKEADEAGVA